MSYAAWGGWTLVEWLLLIERELLLFALFWFVIGMVDELAIDVIWFCLRLRPGTVRRICLAPYLMGVWTDA
jgi:adsorption protein B